MLNVPKRLHNCLEVSLIVISFLPLQFQVYNTILRKHPIGDFEFFEKSKNLFSTTIFVLVSAIQKLSRVTNHSADLRLYRGLGGTVLLPEAFSVMDEYGCTGFTEWGFMSTTSSKEIAIDYSGVKNIGSLPIVLEIRGGSIDRGACIQSFSQYPREREYLFVPCSFLEQESEQYVEVTPDGIVIVIPVKINANLRTKTVDAYREQQKELHISSFRYLIDEIKEQITANETMAKAEQRLALDSSRGTHTVESFLNNIVEKCNNVYSRHLAVNAEEFINDKKFRKMVLEMVDVRMMAMSKLQEWLDNTSSSFIAYRMTAELRTVHRRRINFLAQQLATTSPDSKIKFALDLSTAKGLIIDSINEENDLGESPLMAAAAEGRSAGDLEILVEAKADLTAFRPDGVCAMWLAAQFGHVHCIQVLEERKASIDQVSKDGTSPVSIAAQMGNTQCVALLVELKADIHKVNDKLLTPLHQAAMNGKSETVLLLAKHGADINQKVTSGETALVLAQKNHHEECVEILKKLGGKVLLPESEVRLLRPKKLIISTGDISDVDGLFALAEYRKTGADVLFIMNFPAYIGISAAASDVSYEAKNPGLGFKYSVEDVSLQVPAKVSDSEDYQRLDKRYNGLSNADQMKAALTDVAYEIVVRIWNEGDAEKGRLFFCIGGINSVNPFSPEAVKNELCAYSKLISEPSKNLSTVEGTIYVHDESDPCNLNLSDYADIFMDFNGPMSFFHDGWREKLSDPCVVRSIKGVFIMGGVFASEKPSTSPAIPGKVNRFSSATMNQLYHPQRTADFFAFLQTYKIPAFVVANNRVKSFATFDEGTKSMNTRGVEDFLVSNNLHGSFLKQVALAHYTSFYEPPRKPFDYYTAVALTATMHGSANLAVKKLSRLFYSGVYGLALISESESWEATRMLYASNIDVSSRDEDIPLEKATKENFRKELAIMAKLDVMASLPVASVSFKACEQSNQFKIELDLGN
jgi:ankyrin repeat protein